MLLLAASCLVYCVMPPRPWTATTLYRSPVGAFDPRGCDAAGLGRFVDGNTLQRDHFFLSMLPVNCPVARFSTAIFERRDPEPNCTSSDSESQLVARRSVDPWDWFCGGGEGVLK